MVHHGQLYLRDIVPPRSRYLDRGRFGRLFPTLPPFAPDTQKVREGLLDIGKPGGVMDPGGTANEDNPKIPAGWTFFGQFLDHDITFDPTSSLERQNDPESIENFRTPAFELDSVYGSGRAASPHLYDNSTGNLKLLIDAVAPRDLPRNSQNTAIIGDPRNDENVIVSQFQLAFLKFHNAAIDKLQADGVEKSRLFDEAQRLVRWHYQWIILHKFLPLIVGDTTVKRVLERRDYFNWRNEPFIAVEFSVAAYRFGHSQVRPGYQVNSGFAAVLFDENEFGKPDPNDLSGGARAPRRFVEWDKFFSINGSTPQNSKRIDTVLSGPLFKLPFVPPNLSGNPQSLAQRNLLRHLTFSLPSGQSVARAMRVKDPLSRNDLQDIAPFDVETPLWFYILREAEKREGGSRLGPVGARIVAEVFIGLLQGDRMSFLRQDPAWKPTLGGGDDFDITDLLKFAGVA